MKNQIVREIAQLGNPVLRKKARAVTDLRAEKVIQIVDDMLFTLSESNGVGLAAPQISESICVVIIASRPSKRYPLAPEMEPIVMFNPGFIALTDEKKKDWEGCLSIPGIRALVPRYQKIKIIFLNQQGEKQEMIAEDFIARVFQHEFDHLNGRVYLDQVENNQDIISEQEFQKIIENSE